MARRVITAIVRAVARIFFRRIETVGEVPRDAAVIFAVNHPNALIDPLFLVAFSSRRVSVLAKAPLFTMPIIGWLIKKFDSIPVYRKQDNVSGSNRETFDRARSVLAGGGAIAIFPEGTTHSDPKMRELKTGAARIALGAGIPVVIVPTGLYYTAKHTFRSSALVVFSEPIEVDPQPLDEAGEPDAAAAEALTRRVESALHAVTLQADSHDALELIGRAERIFSADRDRSLAEELDLRRRFVDGYRYLREHDPLRLARLEAEVAASAPASDAPHRSRAALFLLPFGFAGAVIHWPIYKLIDLVARRADSEMAATVKVVSGTVFYPLWWLLIALFAGPWALLAPLLGYLAVVSAEALESLGRRKGNERLREEIFSVAAEITAQPDRRLPAGRTAGS